MIKWSVLVVVFVLNPALQMAWAQQTPPRPYVVGGEISEPMPWMASLLQYDPESRNYMTFCGGALLSSRVVITAAHCIDSSMGKLYVSLGAHQISKIKKSNVIAVEATFVHPDYPGATLKNDIALLFLEEETASTPIATQSKRAWKGGEALSVFGFGNASSYGSLFLDDFYRGELEVMALSQCQTKGEYYEVVDDTQICAHHRGGGVDACQGDSGGPLVSYASGKAELVGLVSYGEGCALPDRPTVYTQVADQESWIQTTLDMIENLSSLDSEQISAIDSSLFLDSNIYSIETKLSQPHAKSGVLKENLSLQGHHYQLEKPGAIYGLPNLQDTSTKEFNGFKFTKTVKVHKESQSFVNLIEIKSLDGAFVQTWASEDSKTLVSENLICNLKDSSVFMSGFTQAGFDASFFTVNYEDLPFEPIDPQDIKKGRQLHACESPHGSYEFFEVPNEAYWIVHGTGPLFAPYESEYFMIPHAFQNEKPLTLTLNVSQRTDSVYQGTLEIQNTNTFDIMTWQLVCDDASFTFDEKPVDSISPLFSEAKDTLTGRIKAQSKLLFAQFKIVFSGSYSPNPSCRVNDQPVIFEINEH